MHTYDAKHSDLNSINTISPNLMLTKITRYAVISALLLLHTSVLVVSDDHFLIVLSLICA